MFEPVACRSGVPASAVSVGCCTAVVASEPGSRRGGCMRAKGMPLGRGLAPGEKGGGTQLLPPLSPFGKLSGHFHQHTTDASINTRLRVWQYQAAVLVRTRARSLTIAQPRSLVCCPPRSWIYDDRIPAIAPRGRSRGGRHRTYAIGIKTPFRGRVTQFTRGLGPNSRNKNGSSFRESTVQLLLSVRRARGEGRAPRKPNSETVFLRI